MSGSLDPQGPIAEAMAGLWWLMLALGIAVFVVFAVLLAVGLFRRPDADPTPEREDRLLFGWGVAGPAVILVVVFAATVWAMRSVPIEAPEDALVVEIVGHQFFYDVRYPDHGVSTRDELRIPTGRPIELRLTSTDVIHSFWVPELGGKLDMLPDGVNTLVLEADVPGSYVSRCAEFCGLEHTSMQLDVVAQEPDAFDSWLEGLAHSGGAELAATTDGER